LKRFKGKEKKKKTIASEVILILQMMKKTIVSLKEMRMDGHPTRRKSET
jgi:hypothetical protein